MHFPTPVISISIITYNQREVIGRAIDSVLAQRINVPYEIIVGDDCSDDGTQEVLLGYQRRYPEIIQLILHPRRYEGEIVGRTNNVTNLTNCRGKYTAMLDGDDYWTDRDKLQKQYDRLENAPALVMTLHDSLRVPEGEVPSASLHDAFSLQGSIRTSGKYTHDDVVRRRLMVQISSLFFRTRCFTYFPEWFYAIAPADTALLFLISQQGGVYYDADPMSVYTVSPASISGSYFRSEELTLKRIADIKVLAHNFPALGFRYRDHEHYAYLYWRMFRITAYRYEWSSSAGYLTKTLRCNPYYIAKAVGARVKNALPFSN